MTQDEHFAEQAEKLAGVSAFALEEAYMYAEGIQDPILKNSTIQRIEELTE